MSAAYVVRPLEPKDVPALVELCLEHAMYEGVDIGPGPSEVALRDALFGSRPRLFGWAAVNPRDELVGFVSATFEFATWSACEFAHMDCLYLREQARGAGVGSALVMELIDAARERGVGEIQWQTPHWNADARRFYSRFGATSRDKARFTLRLDSR